MAPDEDSWSFIYARYPCRELQIQTLLTLLERNFPSPASLVVHGLEGTGKSSIVTAILEKIGSPYAIIDSRECITGRQLLERMVSRCLDALSRSGTDFPQLPRCDSLSALHVCLETLIHKQEKFILCLDGIDRQRDAPHTLLPALARMSEYIPNLTIIFIVSVPSPRLFQRPGVPHIHFPPYSKDEIIQVTAMSASPIFLTPIDPNINYTDEEHDEDSKWLWSRFCAVVWDSLGKGAARDAVSFRDACQKLWRPFVQPVVDGTFGTRDFSRLLVNRRSLFKDEEAIHQDIAAGTSTSLNNSSPNGNCNLPYYTRFILCAAYLASFNPPRQDQILFMKNSEKKKRRRNIQKTGKVQKNRRIPRNLLTPSPFPLDRLIAIVQALLPHQMAPTVDVLTQVATLSNLRLLLRAGPAADPLDAGCKWRINCGWEYVTSLGRTVGLDMCDWISGGQD